MCMKNPLAINDKSNINLVFCWLTKRQFKSQLITAALTQVVNDPAIVGLCDYGKNHNHDYFGQ